MSAEVTSTSEHRAVRGQPVDKAALAEWLLAIPHEAELASLHDTDMRGDSGRFIGLKATWRTSL